MERVKDRLIEWGVAALTLPGQAESGDRHVVKPFPNGVLVAALDGLGHGDEAAAAARAAVSALEDHGNGGVIPLLSRCHERLRATRGVVMSLASFNALDGTMTWLGVGNVEGRLVRAAPDARLRHETLLLRGGVVGGQLPELHASILAVAPADTLILATDGIRGDFADGVIPTDPPQRIADLILAQYGKGTDDALVLVARYAGQAP